MTTTSVAVNEARSLDQLYAALSPLGFGAGWNKPTPSLYPEPAKRYVPSRWRYRDGRVALERAGGLIDTSLAERRNLILINPIEGNTYNSTATLVAAYQMLLPGEHARSHRHTPNALRLILEGDGGAYTTVEGTRVPMLPGDVVLTPSWLWHGHGNEGRDPGYWIDYLDVPTVTALEPMFFEIHPDGVQRAARVDDASPLRFPACAWRAQLAQMAPDPSGRFGRRIALDTPSLRTMRLYLMALAGGRSTEPYRTTSNSIYSVVSGRGTSVIDGVELDWEAGDVFVAPAWREHVHRASENAELFRVCDEPMLELLGWLREG
jgi:gentisate 1,2-dioxygenase